MDILKHSAPTVGSKMNSRLITCLPFRERMFFLEVDFTVELNGGNSGLNAVYNSPCSMDLLRKVDFTDWFSEGATHRCRISQTIAVAVYQRQPHSSAFDGPQNPNI